MIRINVVRPTTRTIFALFEPFGDTIGVENVVAASGSVDLLAVLVLGYTNGTRVY
jgi:hypothetical protein